MKQEAVGLQPLWYITNLVLNAVDALNGRQGTISVATQAVDLTPHDLSRRHLGTHCMPGPYVALSVADTGCGMDTATQAKIFDPFFTTKASGRDLGLAALLGVIRSHFGTIEVSSEPEQGTRMRIYFPVASALALPRYHSVTMPQAGV